jgi:hypothetical protein
MLTVPSLQKFGWSLVVQTEPWAVVEFGGDVLEVLVAPDAEVGALRHVLAQKPVGVLVASALPG